MQTRLSRVVLSAAVSKIFRSWLHHLASKSTHRHRRPAGRIVLAQFCSFRFQLHHLRGQIHSNQQNLLCPVYLSLHVVLHPAVGWKRVAEHPEIAKFLTQQAIEQQPAGREVASGISPRLELRQTCSVAEGTILVQRTIPGQQNI